MPILELPMTSDSPGNVQNEKLYHHGDLRTALLRATAELLDENGVDKFTLRACARRAGVSHAAPAHHFGDTQGLLTAYATAGFEHLAEDMAQGKNHSHGNVLLALHAVGMAYIRFAVSHPSQFDLMFRSRLINTADTDYQRAAQRTFAHLQAALADLDNRASIHAQEFQVRCQLAWSAVHGVSALTLDAGLSAARAGLGVDIETQASELLRQLLPSLLPPSGGPAVPPVGP